MIEYKKATIEDMEAIHSLVKELAVYEKAAFEVDTTVQNYEVDFKDNWFDAIVAIDGESIVGLALYYKSYSTWKGRMIYLEDLIVTQSYRRQGIGLELLRQLEIEAKSMKAKLMKWQVLDWNTPAIDFYNTLGVKIEKEWYNCKKML